MSFAGTWVKLEAIVLGKLTQELKAKHCILSLKNGRCTMRTHGHREGNNRHWGLPTSGVWGRAFGKIANIC